MLATDMIHTPYSGKYSSMFYCFDRYRLYLEDCVIHSLTVVGSMTYTLWMNQLEVVNHAECDRYQLYCGNHTTHGITVRWVVRCFYCFQWYNLFLENFVTHRQWVNWWFITCFLAQWTNLLATHAATTIIFSSLLSLWSTYRVMVGSWGFRFDPSNNWGLGTSH